MLRILLGLALGLAVAWLALVLLLVRARPAGGALAEATRLLPDALRLLRDLARDPSLPRGVRVRLVLLLVYLACPIDLVPDFLPVIGLADDVILAVLVLRSVLRRAGPEAVRRHWRGTPAGLEAILRAAGG